MCIEKVIWFWLVENSYRVVTAMIDVKFYPYWVNFHITLHYALCIWCKKDRNILCIFKIQIRIKKLTLRFVINENRNSYRSVREIIRLVVWSVSEKRQTLIQDENVSCCNNVRVKDRHVAKMPNWDATKQNKNLYGTNFNSIT